LADKLSQAGLVGLEGAFSQDVFKTKAREGDNFLVLPDDGGLIACSCTVWV